MTTVGVLVLHAAAGLAMWTGSTITGAPLGIGAALAGALNTAPIAWLSVGAASLAVGWLPSAVGAIGAVPVAGGFLLNVITQGTGAPTWVADLSPFVHLAAVPNAPPDWVAISVLTIIGAVLIALGLRRIPPPRPDHMNREQTMIDPDRIVLICTPKTSPRNFR